MWRRMWREREFWGWKNSVEEKENQVSHPEKKRSWNRDEGDRKRESPVGKNAQKQDGRIADLLPIRSYREKKYRNERKRWQDAASQFFSELELTPASWHCLWVCVHADPTSRQAFSERQSRVKRPEPLQWDWNLHFLDITAIWWKCFPKLGVWFIMRCLQNPNCYIQFLPLLCFNRILIRSSAKFNTVWCHKSEITLVSKIQKRSRL